ncbi:class I SAM-dependent methyltransferase [Streptomyces microflavus]|uniref:class I SAM-dependent methyltransferase n=1 Tax=Streptomyces microflavus TaxID=1919 RepID=UPI00364A3EB3
MPEPESQYPSYDDAGATAAYVTTDRGTDWLLGHFFVFEALGLPTLGAGKVLDFGCGPGAVADFAARRFGVRVLATDVAPAMLEMARKRGTPDVEYHQLTEGRAVGLPDACADAAMCSFVLTAVPAIEGLRTALSEIRRLMKPGARLAILGTDPDCLGMSFTSVEPGEPGVNYQTGDVVPVRLRTVDGAWQQFTNYYWPLSVYENLLAEAGFSGIEQHRPTVDQAESVADPELFHSSEWAAEQACPPLIIITADA